MILTIEFTADHIHIIEEKIGSKSIEIKRFLEVKMPDGSYLNGIVVNTAAVGAAIQVALKENRISSKKVIVSASSTDVLHKEFQVPAGKPRQLRGMVENELNKSGMLRPEYLFDYIQKKDESEGNEKGSPGMQNVDVYLMPRALVNNYLTTIRRAGLTAYRLETVSSGMERLARLLNLDKAEDMSILCCAEREQLGFLFVGAGNKMIYRSTMIRPEDNLEENAFIVSAVQSLRNEKDPYDVALEEIIENVSKLVQFHSQTGKGNRVSQILIYGDLSKETSLLEKIENLTGIPTRQCPLPGFVSVESGQEMRALNLVGASVGGFAELKEMNALKFFQLMKQNRKEGVTKKDLLPLAIGMGFVVILAGVYCVVSFQNRTEEASAATVLEYAANPDILSKYQEAKNLEGNLMSLKAYNETCDGYIEVIKSTRRLESSDFKKFFELKPSDVTIESQSFSSGVMTIGCQTTIQEGASNYAKILTDSGLYADVKYTGFSGGITDKGKGNYSFTLVCTLWKSQEETNE